MVLTLLGVTLGLALLIAGGTLLVHGASRIATTLGVAPAVVGLTIVAFGTSAPELVVNITGALNDQAGLAFGNVAGSNIANLSLVLGAAALFHTIAIRGELVLREVPLLLLGAAAVTAMALDGILDGNAPILSRSDGVVLLLLFGIFIYITVLDYVRSRGDDALMANIADSALVPAASRGVLAWPAALGGLALLGVGGSVTIDQSVELASALGVRATIIGLFVVAIGTSMPELVTSVIAALRGETDLALGNVVGSNLFNSLFVLPVSALITPVPIPEGGVADLLVSLALTAILIPIFLLGQASLKRPIGLLLVILYGVYASLRFTV